MTSYWQLQPVFGSYLLVVVVTTATLGLLFLGPSFGQLTTDRRRWLTILRACLAVMLCLAMLRPTYVRTTKIAQTAYLPLLFDVSRSMDHRDGVQGNTRWEEQLSLLRQAIPQLKEMGERFEVELLGFSSELHPQPSDGGSLNVNAKPTGDETDIGRAISETLQRRVGRRMAAMILVSDGSQRAIAPQTSPEQAARQLDRRSVPLYTIAIGHARDQSQARDVAIENLEDEYSVFVKNEFALRVGVRIQGYVHQPISVSLTVEDELGASTSVGPIELTATQDSQIVMGDFSYRPEQPGQYKLRVKAADQIGEMIDNNQKTAFLNVREGGLRVLLLTGAMFSEEPKFIRRSLDKSQDIELDSRLVSAVSRNEWPIDLEGNGIELDEYDVFIIGDLDARALHDRNWSRLFSLVESGRGLIMYGGYHSFGPGGYFDTALDDVLPVIMNRRERELDPTQATRKDLHLDGEIVMLPNEDESENPILHLAKSDNLAVWRSLKPLKGANKVSVKGDGVVLAKSAEGDPLLVRSTSSLGRVLAFAGDSTYRWWKYGQQDLHKRFWRQTILWLARRDKKDANSLFIDLPRRRIQAGSRLSFTAGLTDEVGDVVVGSGLLATLTHPNGDKRALAVRETAEGVQGVINDVSLPGDYRVTVNTPDSDGSLTAHKDFVVEKMDFELSDPAANPGLLGLLARATSRIGGKAVAPEQLPELLRQIKASPPEDEVETQSKWQPGDTSLDAWFFFLLLVGLLSVEWFLRKRWGLV